MGSHEMITGNSAQTRRRGGSAGTNAGCGGNFASRKQLGVLTMIGKMDKAMIEEAWSYIHDSEKRHDVLEWAKRNDPLYATLIRITSECSPSVQCEMIIVGLLADRARMANEHLKLLRGLPPQIVQTNQLPVTNSYTLNVDGKLMNSDRRTLAEKIDDHG
jgi:hypothetical protein